MPFKKLLLSLSFIGALFLGGSILASAAGCAPFVVASGGTGVCNIVASFIPFGNGTSPIATSSTLFFTTAANRLNFTFASSTTQTISGTASTTNLIVSSAGGTAGCATFSANGTISNTASACGSSSGLSSYDAFTHPSYAGQFTSASSTGIWLTGSPLSLIASSTFATNSTTTNATSTTLNVSGQFTNGASTGLAYETSGVFSALANGTNGQIHAMVNGTPGWVATTTAGTGLAYTGSAFTLASIAANSVLGTFAAGIPSAIGTTSLYTGSAGQTLAFLNGAWIGAATTTFNSPLTYSNGSVSCASCNTSSASVTSITNGGGLDFSVSPITTSGTITAQVGTSSVPTVGQLSYWTSAATPSQLGTVATSSTSLSTSGFLTTGTIGNFVGGSASTIKQLENRSFSYATTTWVGTTTITLESGYGELWNYAQCWTVPNGATLNVDFYFRNNAAASHLDFINASSTNGRFAFTTNNTLTANATTSVDIGKPASSPTSITCTINDTI